ncbi:MAG: protein-L-isoaspartate(D-aspartate) O-methyltransferase [Verrucomicrobiota bacterium]
MKKPHLALAVGLVTMACGEKAVTPVPQAPQRAEMVATQIASRGVADGRVLAAMRKVPRHRFVPAEIKDRAYEDRPLPIGYGQTISQPYIVACMTEALELKGIEKVLEIGTGTGYQAAVFAELVKEVYSIEIVKPLGELAAKVLTEMGCHNVRTRIGDGYRGWPEAAPFDSIMVTCAPDKIPQPLVDQLAEGGRMIIPVGGENEPQQLILLVKKAGKIERKNVLPVRFVPMTGEADR